MLIKINSILISTDDITNKLGSILGNGTFCDVLALNKSTEFVTKLVSPGRKEGISRSSKKVNSMAMIFPNDLTDSCEDELPSLYAIKKLKPDLQGAIRVSGAVDLCIEALFLSRLSHPNIVSFHGSGGTPGSSDFFIIIGQVQRTLQSEIKTWKRQKDGTHQNFRDRKERQLSVKTEFHKRLTVALQLASGLTYLHEQS